ncbi:hypothetical protein J6590_027557 [Homalodisca vitripennis]|nr:hypothetical protein J6590_027557 [Homalodisca vitripennis]
MRCGMPLTAVTTQWAHAHLIQCFQLLKNPVPTVRDDPVGTQLYRIARHGTAATLEQLPS